MADAGNANYQKTIVTLASSRKPGGRCVAGKEAASIGYGPWVRPVSVRPGAEIELTERLYGDGTEPKLLDVVRIPMLAPAPRLHQTENHMIDARFYWQKVGALDWTHVAALADSPEILWANNNSSQNGINDRLTEVQINGLTNSLFLIRPDNVTIQVLTPGANFGDWKRKVRADFYSNGAHYNFTVTDPDVERIFFARSNGEYPVAQNAYFCISLAESSYEGNYYKLVASIITKQPL